MAIQIELKRDFRVLLMSEKLVEDTIQECIGTHATSGDLEWSGFTPAGLYHHRVVIKGATQTREQIFLEKADQLIGPLAAWLKLYPFR